MHTRYGVLADQVSRDLGARREGIGNAPGPGPAEQRNGLSAGPDIPSSSERLLTYRSSVYPQSAWVGGPIMRHPYAFHQASDSPAIPHAKVASREYILIHAY